MKAHALGLTVLLLVALAGCGADPGLPFIAGPPDASAPGPAPTTETESGNPGPGPEATDAGADAAPVVPGPAGIDDPEKDGPFAIEERKGTVSEREVHALYPKTGGPQPIIVFAHGFQLAPSQYESHLKRLASFGYVALTVDYDASLAGSDNPAQAKELIAGIDWAKSDAKVGPHADTTKVGMSGHSLGGKLALLAATLDPRVKAAIVLDPVDGGGPTGCNEPKCVTVANKLGALAIPTAFLGETLDSQGVGQACAPTTLNFMSFYAKAKAPVLAVTIAGASHMSFIDDREACGIPCNFCKTATTPHAGVAAIAHAYVVAFSSATSAAPPATTPTSPASPRRSGG